MCEDDEIVVFRFDFIFIESDRFNMENGSNLI